MKAIDENTVGGRIRKARVGCRLTTRELAEKVGVSQNYLSVVERNDKKQASPALLQKVSEVTGVSLAWLRNGDSVATEAAQFDDVQLLLTLIMQQEPTVTREVVSAVLAVDPGIVDAILSGNAEYDPMWESGLSNLIQRMDLSIVRKKIRALDALLQLEQEKQIGIELFWTLRKYFTKKFKSSFKFGGQPFKVQDEPAYTQFTLQREDKPETWVIQHYSSVLDEEELPDILRQAEAAAENVHAVVAVSDEGSYNKIMALYDKILSYREQSEELELLQGMPVSNRMFPPVYFILVDSDTASIKGMEKMQYNFE